MNAPEFWYQKCTLLGTFLAPLGWLYNLAVRLRFMLTKPKKLEVPVLCIGNLVVGGAGKTPTVLALAALLKNTNTLKLAIVTRGYGGQLTGPIKVDLGLHHWPQIGDEAILLAQVAPTWIAQDRYAGAKAAIAQGANLIILDDGFQNPTLHKDLSLLVINSAQGIGNGYVMPAGPLRETLADGLKRTQGIIYIGPNAHVYKGIDAYAATVVPSPDSLNQIAGQRILAFCGLGFPQKFYQSLKEAGADIIETVSFSDHHPYGIQDIQTLVDRAKFLKAVLVTTAKDMVRIPPQFQREIISFKIQLKFEDPEKILSRIGKIL